MWDFLTRLFVKPILGAAVVEPTAVRHKGVVVYGFLWTPDDGFEPSHKDVKYWTARGYEIYDVKMTNWLNHSEQVDLGREIEYTYSVRKKDLANG
jgi:hypothetical protein